MHDSPSTLGAYRPARRRPTATGPCDQVIALVARQKNVPLQMFTTRRRHRAPVARARQLAMYLSQVILGRTLTEIGEIFGRDRTTVSYACALIEDLRDNPQFDDEVSALERQIQAGMVAAGAGTHG
jgi:chromosomal replication initiation ATPase DnaA